MSDSEVQPDDRERQLDAIIAEYYRLEEKGEHPDRTEFIARYPEFQQELSEFFVDLGMFEHSGRSDSDDPALEPTITAGTSQRKYLAAGVVVRYFGVYEILEELGSGGMGVVYKARHAQLRKLVALKMIRAGELASAFEVKMFQAEARAAAKLDHPGIVAVHEVGMHAGQHFYSMDYIAGGSLSKLHRDEPIAARRAADLVRQMAEAIHYAHGMGIVHRDLKPANVLLTTTGVPRITDFGLAKRMWADEDSMSAHITETGQILGTAGYMSPEQAEGKTRLVGEPADIYSLGAVLYALLTSRAPFVGESQADTIKQVIEKEPVSPRVLNPSLPRDLETICLKCLNKERHERYGTAQLLAEDLQRFLEGRPVLARPISRPARAWRWCRRNSAVATLLGLVLLVAIGSPIVAWQQYNLKKTLAGSLDAKKRASEAARQSAQSERRRRYVSDMNLVAFHWNSGDLAAVRALLLRQKPQQGEEDLREFMWRYWSNLLQSHDLIPRTVLPFFSPGIAISPDGKRIAFSPAYKNIAASSSHSIHVHRADPLADGEAEFRLPLLDQQGTVNVKDFAFLLDANVLVVFENNGVTFWDLSGTVARKENLPFTTTPEDSVGEGWLSENGRYLIFNRVSRTTDAVKRSGDVTHEVWDLMERKCIGKASSLLSIIRDMSISNDGKHFAASDGSVWELNEEKDEYFLDRTQVAARRWEGGNVDTDQGRVQIPEGFERVDMGKVHLLPQSEKLVTLDHKGRLSIWDSDGREQLVAENAVTFAVSGFRQEICWKQKPLSKTEDSVFVQLLDPDAAPRRLIHPSAYALKYAPNGKDLLVADGRFIMSWPLDSTRNADSPPLRTQGVSFAASPLGKYVASNHGIWETASGRQLSEHHLAACKIAVTDDGEVVTCNRGDTVEIWDGLEGEHSEYLQQPPEPETSRNAAARKLLSVSVSYDGNLIAAIRIDGKIVVWDRKQKSSRWLDAKTSVAYPHLSELAFAMLPVQFSPDGKLLAAHCVQGFRIWNTSTFQAIPEQKPWGAFFRSRDEWLVSERLSEGEMQLLNFATRQPVQLPGIPTGFYSLAETADGKNIATLSKVGLTIWDSRVAAPLFTADAQSGTLHFLESDRVLALIQNDGSIQRWSIDGSDSEQPAAVPVRR